MAAPPRVNWIPLLVSLASLWCAGFSCLSGGCFRLVFVYTCGRVGVVGRCLWVGLCLSCLLVGFILHVFPRV